MHIGYKNMNFGYEMEGQWLEESTYKRDLGIFIDSSLKMSRQCLEPRNRANRMLGFIARNVDYKSKDVIRRLCIAYVTFKNRLDRDMSNMGYI